MVDLCTYYLCLHYVFISKDLYLGLISAPYVCLVASNTTGFITNFTISKLFVFRGDSNRRARDHFLRFAIVVLIGFALNYMFMKTMISMGAYPTVARLIALITVAGLSFTMHKKFTFRVREQS